jgi:hypothetical protein
VEVARRGQHLDRAQRLRSAQDVGDWVIGPKELERMLQQVIGQDAG